MNEDLRFPVGKFEDSREKSNEVRREYIKTISELPKALREACKGLSEEQLETAYRPDGWTVKQVVHHVADSHANSLIRFKLALTEDSPLIKTYHEDLWAELPDAKHAPIELSLMMIDAIHQRWALLLNSMEPEDFEKNLRHPEHGEVSLNYMLGLYDWHSRHHTAHITHLRERSGW
jgi:uncharacterized damage-inducible protein DinB